MDCLSVRYTETQYLLLILMKKRIDYNSYIKSPEWKAKRDKVFRMKGRICQKCGCVEHLQVHHASYNNL